MNSNTSPQVPESKELFTVEELNAFLAQHNAILVDVRELDEQPKITKYKVLELPLSQFPLQWEQLRAYSAICFVCVAGVRSIKALNLVAELLPNTPLRSFKLGFSALL